MLELIKTEQGYTIKATANHGARTADSVRDFEPPHQALSAVIKIIRLEELYSQIIEIERPKSQSGKDQPSMLNNVDGVSSLRAEPSDAKQRGSKEEVEQPSAVHEAGHLLEDTSQAVDLEQMVSGESIPSISTENIRCLSWQPYH